MLSKYLLCALPNLRFRVDCNRLFKPLVRFRKVALIERYYAEVEQPHLMLRVVGQRCLHFFDRRRGIAAFIITNSHIHSGVRVRGLKAQIFFIRIDGARHKFRIVKCVRQTKQCAGILGVRVHSFLERFNVAQECRAYNRR